jgi:hypothetical protein
VHAARLPGCWPATRFGLLSGDLRSVTGGLAANCRWVTARSGHRPVAPTFFPR